MIKREELLRIASLKGLPPRLAELDYLQDIALLGIYREFGNKLIFKGGTGLYKLYQLNRFSEDLDFTAEKKFKPKDFFARLPALFSLFKINCSVKVEQFPQSINVYVEINGPLYDGRKESRSRLIMNISLREKVFSPLTRLPYISLYQEVRPFDIYAMEEKEILAEKVRAVHQREKARDSGSTFDVMPDERLMRSIEEKIDILKWMVSSNINDINQIGLIMSKYYRKLSFI